MIFMLFGVQIVLLILHGYITTHLLDKVASLDVTLTAAASVASQLYAPPSVAVTLVIVKLVVFCPDMCPGSAISSTLLNNHL